LGYFAESSQCKRLTLISLFPYSSLFLNNKINLIVAEYDSNMLYGSMYRFHSINKFYRCHNKSNVHQLCLASRNIDFQ
jgi:hypothetical protein